MAYMLNIPPNQAVNGSKPVITTDSNEQMARLQEQNQTLQRKLHSKTTENQRLTAKLEKLESDLELYKQLLQQINQNLSNGEQVPFIGHSLQAIIESQKAAKAKKIVGKKSKPNCNCCAAAEKPYLCDWNGCEKRFSQKAHLEAHKNSTHTGRRFVCEWPNCGKSFCRKYNLVEHSKMHSAENPNQCTFNNCGQTFSTKHGLQRHQQAQHQLIISSFKRH